MTNLMILKSELRRPSSSNDNWTIPIMLWNGTGLEKRYPSIDGVEFANLFKLHTGRYPDHESGVDSEFQDVLTNWDQLEEGLVKVLLPRLGQ